MMYIYIYIYIKQSKKKDMDISFFIVLKYFWPSDIVERKRSGKKKFPLQNAIRDGTKMYNWWNIYDCWEKIIICYKSFF